MVMLLLQIAVPGKSTLSLPTKITKEPIFDVDDIDNDKDGDMP
jgi:hypothetical protein